MASNISSGGWRVKILYIPKDISKTQFSEILDVPTSHIFMPKVENNDAPYAWIDHFANEEEAKEFVLRWTGRSILGQNIKCVTSPPRNNDKNVSHSYNESSKRDNNTRKYKVHGSLATTRQEDSSSSTTAVSLMSVMTSASSFSEINEHENKSKKPPVHSSAQIAQQSKPTGPFVPRRSMQTQGVEDKRPLCRYAKEGICRKRSNECRYRHQRCNNFETCSNVNCQLAHAKKATIPDFRPLSPSSTSVRSSSEESERDRTVSNLNRRRSHSRSSISSIQSISSTQSTNTRMKPCRNGIKCYNADCQFDHPDGWNPCPVGIKCRKFDCTANHPPKRKGKCHKGDRCKRIKCSFLHPKTRSQLCPLRGKCQKWDCPKIHPYSRARPCPDKEKCTNMTCLCLHPMEREKFVCSVGADCRDLSCKLNHPPERPPVCVQGDTCSNFNCTRLHGPDWNPCEAGDDCEDENCTKIHSSDRNTDLQGKTKTPTTTTATNKNKSQKTRKKNLKTLEQRMKDWEKAQLPILSCRTEFCQRLQNEHILVVTAETGSGKSTQLPQYAAENFGSLVVCTQPRVVAALSLARRVAEEYDGTSVGESVGYKVGNANRVNGSSIMFMTDAALIRESQRDPSLKHIRVLIIDEAHERSLNTDIVIGIAKILLRERPNDFYVVIASATIDPTRFLHYFDRPTSKPLDVKGRVFPVGLLCKPPPANSSDQKLIETHIIPSLIELYPRHEGHTLVFLPGQGEIERALKIFKSKLPDDCIALPLYGSQSPEDQEKVIKFNEKNKRMVVFCTNVAETSLTIPNVRLVIDSGWAKEARFDVKRRLTVIETVRIARSSADQRKGRAGRTAAGYCVRLYNDDELKRASIEPEILRSSLDLVLLQLVRLNLDPRTFPFMDQPDNEIINTSMDLLNKLKCIDSQKLTQRGELCTELGLDPRFSAFIVEIYMEYESLLELAVAIVAILSAPGTVFFMGGSTAEAKQKAKDRVAVQAQNHKSDLIHLYSVYQNWKNAGAKETQGKCSQCTRQIKFCICRIKYSNEHSLNNKILQNVDASVTSIIKQIKAARWLRAGNGMPQNSLDIVGLQLAQLFPEQCGYLLVPQLPSEGVRLISTDLRAMITNTSVFVQKLHTDINRELYQHFVAMTITQLTSGNYIVEKLHPVPRSVAANQSPITLLYAIENISSEIFQRMRDKLNTYQKEPWAKWVVYEYDRVRSRFILWGIPTEKVKVTSIVQNIYDEVSKKFSDDHNLLECGPIKANFKSGLICTHINKMTNALRLDLQNLPNFKPNELKDWLKKMAGIEWDEIKDHGFNINKDEKDKNNKNDLTRNLYLIFKNEDAYNRAKNKIPPYYLNESGDSFGTRRDAERDTWGRELVIKTPTNITEQDIINRYGTNVIIKCSQLNRDTEKKRVESSFKLSDLPLTSDENFLRQCLQASNGPTPKYVHVGRTKNNLSGYAKLTFHDEEQRNRAAAIYDITLCQNSFPIIIQGKKGPMQKFIQTKLEKDDEKNNEQTQPSLTKNLFKIIVISREEALRIYSSQTSTTSSVKGATATIDPNDNSEWKIDGTATVTVLRADLYPDFEQIVQNICRKFNVKVKSKPLPHHSLRYIFTDGTPQKTSLAASMVAQHFAPMNIKLITDRQKRLFNELEEIGRLQTWAKELSLATSKNRFNTNIEIRGPQIAQGQLMRRIADYSDDFDKRFREHELSRIVAAFFGRQKAASVKLEEINSRWSSKSCSVSFIPKTSTIVISGKPNASLKNIDDCENEVLQLLDQITGSTNDDESEDEDEEDEADEQEEDDDDDDDDDDDINSIKTIRQDRRCVFCKQKSSISTSVFRICGHTYCRCAVQALSSSISFPLRCKDCQTNIHIRDIETIFSNNKQSLLHLLKNSIQDYLTKNAKQDDRIFCPNDECEGLIKLTLGYQTCLTCGQDVCPRCQAIDAELHRGRTCEQLIQEKKRREFLPQLFEAAKKFVQDNWPVDAAMRPIGRLDENPYLEKQYKTLKRFYEGNKVLGHPFPPDLTKGFFAYHGCAFQAINGISQHGFDPKRRSGQVHGRGEYFGVTANISHGYAERGGRQSGFSQMIIAFLLRCPQIKTVENFCYVVDNPIDWKYAFNVPVLIVTYGTNAAIQPSPFPNVINDYVDNESSWNAPFRWYWRQDNGQFEPYNDIINEILEKFYEQWKLHGGPPTVVTPPLTRYIDDIPQTYKIDYQNNRQTNTKTSYPRIIDRRPVDNASGNKNWSYQNEHGEWKPYETLIQDIIEKGYQAYRSGRGPSAIDIQFPGRPETYQLNFLTGQQTNKTSGAVKNIKRE